MNIIYCGGRFDFDYLDDDYRIKAADDYRAILLKDTDLFLKGSGAVSLSDKLIYIGPYYFETDGMQDKDIVETEMAQINDCTVAVFYIDDHFCPGTVAEMVYAAMIHKRMIVFYIKDERETESTLMSSCWYPMIMCQRVNHSLVEFAQCSDRSEARNRILEYIHSFLW